MNARQLAAGRLGSPGARSATAGPRRSLLRDRRVLIGAAAVVVILVVAQVVGAQNPSGASGGAAACTLKPFRQDHAAELIKGGAVIAYERNGGSGCVDELYAIYPDGRIVGDNGAQTVKKQALPADVDALLGSINDLGWFTDNMYSTTEIQCGQCFTYYTAVSYKGVLKTVKAVDGGTAAPANYWLMTGRLSTILPAFGAGAQ